MKSNVTSRVVATGIGGYDVTIWFCPHLFFHFPLPFQSHDLMSHGLSPDLSPDFHMTTPFFIVLAAAHCPPY